MGMEAFRKAYKTNPALESEGVWIDLQGGVSLKCRRASRANREYRAALNRMLKKYGRQLDVGAIDLDIQDELLYGVYAETIVTDWKNVEGDNGEKLACTKDNVLWFFNEYPEAFVDVQSLCQERAVYLDELEGDEVKN